MRVVFGAVLVLTGWISPIFSTQLLIILQSHGMSLSEAVAIGALFGPARVAIRALDMLSSGRLYPRIGMIIAASCKALGLALLALRTDMPALAIVFYGIGGGLLAVARATLPLALFGPDDYSAIMGQLARHFLPAQAAAPTLGEVAFDHGGAGASLILFLGLTMVNLVAALLLSCFTRG